MSWGRLKLDPADVEFSQFIRLRDGRCVRCGSIVELNDAGLPISHQNSHYFGRGKESTRYDTRNCDCLCGACHQYWGSVDHEEYREFKIDQLGEKEFKLLHIRANTLGAKDRKLALIYARELIKGLKNANLQR